MRKAITGQPARGGASTHITDMQEIVLTLIEKTCFNEFDGKLVAQSLRANKHLWHSVITDFTCGCPFILDDVKVTPGYLREIGIICHSLVTMRDLPENFWAMDTLFIWGVRDKTTELRRVIRTWSPDAIRLVPSRSAAAAMMVSEKEPSGPLLFGVWWD